MKLLTSLLVAASSALVNFFIPTQEASPSGFPVPSPTPLVNAVPTIEHNGTQYRLYTFEVNSLENLSLYSNLSETISSIQFKTDNNCRYLINGGFYSKDKQHIGLLKDSQGTNNPSQENNLFNGYIELTDNNQLVILPQPDFSQNPQFLLQTGPLLIYKGQPQTLTLNQDKSARRSFLVITKNQHLLFGMITTSDNSYTGPYLKDMPEILIKFHQQQELAIGEAINLDGGSASAFITPEISLTELNPIGSFFCYQ